MITDKELIPGYIRRLIIAKSPQEVIDIGYEMMGNPLYFQSIGGSVGVLVVRDVLMQPGEDEADAYNELF